MSIESSSSNSENNGITTVFENEKLIIACGSAHPELAHAVADMLDVVINDPVSRFGDNEINVRFANNLRRKELVIIQPTVPPNVDTHYMEIFVMADAAKRGSVDSVTAVLPYFGYARQDRKAAPRTPITSALMANLLTIAGVHRLVTLDLHAEQAAGAFHAGPWDNLYADPLFLQRLEQDGYNLSELVWMAPDLGGVKRADRYGKSAESPHRAVAFKQRDFNAADQSTTYGMYGDVNHRDVIIVDDLSSSVKTLRDAAIAAEAEGANSVAAIVTHGVFEGQEAINNIQHPTLEAVYTTDSLPPKSVIQALDKVHIITIAPLLAEAIARNQTGESISEIMHNFNPRHVS